MKEVWKDVVGYEGLYKVSNVGRVKSLKKDMILNVKPHYWGYIIVCLTKDKEEKSKRVHRLVAEAFIQNPNNYPYINHINCIKTDNRVENLEWCTQSHNVKHNFKMGVRTLRGEANNMAKLSTKDVVRIKMGLEMGLKQKDLGQMFGVSRVAITNINTGKRWAYVKLNTV